MTPFSLGAGPVRLRRFRPSDLSAFRAYRTDPEVGRYQSWERMDDARALAFIKAVGGGEIAPRGAWNQIAIASAANDGLVGDLGVHVSAEGREAEIGVTLARDAQGLGWATAAVGRMIDYLFEEEGVERIVGIVDKLNAPSARLMERVGMRFVSEEETVFNGAPCVELTYEIKA
ncbi:MAG: GNAT family N-acetyltransferase [Pseudomonadota bacterium]